MMDTFVDFMPLIMIITGLMTFTMIYVALSPTTALRKTFGGSLEGPLADLAARHWGALVALTGLMLIYGAFMADTRYLVLAVASISKLVFAGLVLRNADTFRGTRAMFIAKADLVMVVLYAIYLFVPHPNVVCCAMP
jgi:hypothetical protein